MSHTISNRWAISQRPWDTGKMMLGVHVADIIYKNKTEYGLYVNYTNHVLGSLLKSLMAVGIADVLRIIGSGCVREYVRFQGWYESSGRKREQLI